MSDKTHLGGSYQEGDSNTIMVDVWGYLLVKYEIKSVIDIGCGFGHALQWFAQNGLCAIKGVEGWPEAVEKNLVKGSIVQHDFREGPAPIAQAFDLAWSAEFLEHVEERFLPNVMPLFRMARYACVTHAEPGQGGFHHVNCQGDEYWVRKFAEYGFRHDESETALLRRTDRWRAGWGRRSLMFFTRI
jgi:SAM-dependent methyltransferase